LSSGAATGSLEAQLVVARADALGTPFLLDWRRRTSSASTPSRR
jgi:hypothetical protein